MNLSDENIVLTNVLHHFTANQILNQSPIATLVMRQYGADAEVNKKKLIDLSIQNNVLSPQTAFFASVSKLEIEEAKKFDSEYNTIDTEDLFQLTTSK